MNNEADKQKNTIKKGKVVNLTIDSAAYKGKGVAHYNNMAVFVPNTAPGDVIRARITRKKKSYCEAKMLELLEPASIRQQPKCTHAFQCGGCTWQHLPYSCQLKIKQKQVEDHIHRIGGLTQYKVNRTLASEEPFYYRNKMEYSFGTRRWLSREEIERDEYVSDEGSWAGLHAPGRFDKILNLQECFLQHPISFEILDFTRNYIRKNNIPAYDTIDNTGFIRNLMIRTSHYTDDVMVNIVTFREDNKITRDLSNALLAEFPQITTVVNNVNDKITPTAIGRFENIIYGPGYITDRIGNYSFKIHANAFFQTNTPQAEKLYDVASDFAELEPGDLVFDLYCGIGSLSLFLSEKVKQVIGIEINRVALESAKKNAHENNIKNVRFEEGDMKDVFTHQLFEHYGMPNGIITDPPRAGMHPDVVDTLNRLQVPKLVYVSCNSSTMARDLKKLHKNYIIESIQPVDMFPQTYHIETVAKLKIRS